MSVSIQGVHILGAHSIVVAHPATLRAALLHAHLRGAQQQVAIEAPVYLYIYLYIYTERVSSLPTLPSIDRSPDPSILPSTSSLSPRPLRFIQKLLWAFPKILAFSLVAGTHYQFLWYIFRVFLPGNRQLCQLSRLVQPSQYADILTQKVCYALCYGGSTVHVVLLVLLSCSLITSTYISCMSIVTHSLTHPTATAGVPPIRYFIANWKA